MEYRISVLIFALIILIGCSEDSACLKSSGDAIFYTEAVPAFNHIELNNAIELELVQSNDTLITVSTKENLKNNITFEVVEEKLIIKDNNTCNWLREYNQTKVTIHHPNLKRLDHLGNNVIYSLDTIYYPYLTLYAKNAPGDFKLLINNIKTTISINDLNNITLSGKCNELYVGIYSGDGRINAENLIAKEVGCFQRGSNDILVYPVDLLYGKIIAYGNIIYFNEPPVIEIEDTGKGELIKNP